ncbi:S8 family serine peptidase [Leptolyngbya sp. NIES-2104]|uniref:S8 family serine peptidase n=1 Tax=Leptolyngbya sp. NIES-2104 TaxID=1552121 RepID=UPI0006EC8346|nr:S8 family serine peptidase [Leptolyngbya sp. NIES-2104]GAP94831.1 alkaline protease precursor [Leptolyngbya sp. NIES-2104]
MFNQIKTASIGLEPLDRLTSSFSALDPLRDSSETYRQISRSRFVPALERYSEATPDQSLSAISAQLDFYDDFNPTRGATFKDDYRLNSAAGGQFRIQMNSLEFDTYLQLIDFNTGTVLTDNDDTGSSSNSELTITIEAGKDYLIRATSFALYAIGSYEIEAQQISTTPTPPTSRAFNSTYGYGLVDAAAAVAQAISQSRFADIPNLGGRNWGNDMINAPEVWARNITGRGITVAVIDSGVDITHPDLANNIWVNRREVASDGIDNDQNGYVDDLYGWNFGQGQNNNNVMPGTSDPGQSHGTHVAGTIAALNNEFGVTGVAPNAQIMALRLGDVSNNRFTNGGNLAQAIRYAVDNGARVINLSLGWSDSAELASALSYAAARNVITVSAAGNLAESAPSNPASYATRWGLSVGAVDRNSAIASFSNRAGSDRSLRHVVAPGVEIYSTVPGNYDFSSGTSMAAPAVAGVVALMLSANPNLTHDQVQQIITGSTNRLSTVNQTFAMIDFNQAAIAETSLDYALST